MSWLTPERRAQFQQLQQSRPADDISVSHDENAHLKKAPVKSGVPSSSELIYDDVHGEDGHTQVRRKNWQRPIEVISGPEGITSLQEQIQEQRERSMGIQQQSSGNIAKKLYDEDYWKTLPPESASTPALHLEDFVARSVLPKSPAALASSSLPADHRVSDQQANSPTAKSTSKQKLDRTTVKPATRQKSQKRNNSMVFVNSTGEYMPPRPKAMINTTRTQELRQKQLARSLNASDRQMTTSANPSVQSSGVKSKEAKVSERLARRETYDHATRIINSRTDHHNTSSALTATERYQIFIKTTANGGSPRRGNAAKQRMVERKMDDVFQRLGQDAVTPPFSSSHANHQRLLSHTSTMKNQERNWNRPNLLTSNDPQLQAPSEPGRESSVLSGIRSPNRPLQLPSNRQSALPLVLKQGKKHESPAKSKKNLTKPTVSTSKPNKKRSNKTRIPEDSSTRSTDFSATSVDSSAISFPTETTSVTSETSRSSSRQRKSKNKNGNKKSSVIKHQSLYAARLSRSKPAEKGELVRKLVTEKSPVAFGSAMRPETWTPSMVGQGKLQPKLQDKSAKSFAKKVPPKKGPMMPSEATSTDVTTSSPVLSDLSASSDTTDNDSVDRLDYVKRERSAEDIVKALASKWQMDIAATGRGFASNSQTFSTPADVA